MPKNCTNPESLFQMDTNEGLIRDGGADEGCVSASLLGEEPHWKGTLCKFTKEGMCYEIHSRLLFHPVIRSIYRLCSHGLGAGAQSSVRQGCSG